VSSFKDGHCHAGTQSFDKQGKGSNLLGMGKQIQQAKKVFWFITIITIFWLVKQTSSGAMITFLFNNYSTIFTEPEANNCFSIISELNNRE